MKRFALLLLILTLVVSAAPKIKLMRLNVLNKTDSDVYLQMREINLDQPASYYLHVAPSGEFIPGVGLYTLARGVYEVNVLACGDFEYDQYELDLNRHEFTINVIPGSGSSAVADGLLKIGCSESEEDYAPLFAPFLVIGYRY